MIMVATGRFVPSVLTLKFYFTSVKELAVRSNLGVARNKAMGQEIV